jgi:hypothetical protein
MARWPKYRSSTQVRARYFSPERLADRFWSQPSLSNEYRGLFLNWVKLTTHSKQSRDKECVDIYIHSLTCPNGVNTWLVRHKDNFTFYLKAIDNHRYECTNFRDLHGPFQALMGPIFIREVFSSILSRDIHYPC